MALLTISDLFRYTTPQTATAHPCAAAPENSHFICNNTRNFLFNYMEEI